MANRRFDDILVHVPKNRHGKFRSLIQKLSAKQQNQTLVRRQLHHYLKFDHGNNSTQVYAVAEAGSVNPPTLFFAVAHSHSLSERGRILDANAMKAMGQQLRKRVRDAECGMQQMPGLPMSPGLQQVLQGRCQDLKDPIYSGSPSDLGAIASALRLPIILWEQETKNTFRRISMHTPPGYKRGNFGRTLHISYTMNAAGLYVFSYMHHIVPLSQVDRARMIPIPNNTNSPFNVNNAGPVQNAPQMVYVGNVNVRGERNGGNEPSHGNNMGNGGNLSNSGTLVNGGNNRGNNMNWQGSNNPPPPPQQSPYTPYGIPPPMPVLPVPASQVSSSFEGSSIPTIPLLIGGTLSSLFSIIGATR